MSTALDAPDPKGLGPSVINRPHSRDDLNNGSFTRLGELHMPVPCPYHPFTVA